MAGWHSLLKEYGEFHDNMTSMWISLCTLSVPYMLQQIIFKLTVLNITGSRKLPVLEITQTNKLALVVRFKAFRTTGYFIT